MVCTASLSMVWRTLRRSFFRHCLYEYEYHTILEYFYCVYNIYPTLNPKAETPEP